ncbi:MAG: hypothetical protein OXN21_09700, partial [Chloroflexota bacterium]|nr:hypothetical protein [Chloroflexota bacterium]
MFTKYRLFILMAALFTIFALVACQAEPQIVEVERVVEVEREVHVEVEVEGSSREKFPSRSKGSS